MAAVVRRNATRRGRSEESAVTRSKLLEAAGVIFADKGYDRATAKEIARQAETNAAAVNYHFGGVEALYEEVLALAHHRLVNYHALLDTIVADADPRDRLRHLVETLVATAGASSSASWPARLVSKEILSPTPFIKTVAEREIGPKKMLAFDIVSEILGLPIDHPAVARASFSIISPCLMLLIADRRIAELTPDLSLGGAGMKAMSEQMIAFALGGLDAIAKERVDNRHLRSKL